MARAWYQADDRTFLRADPDAILGILAARLPFALEPTQRAAWQYQIGHLHRVIAQLPGAHLFLEFAIPRMGRRADAIIVYCGIVFVAEYKVGERGFGRHAIEQAHGYALDLKCFHTASHNRLIVPMLIATAARPQPLPLAVFAQDGVAEPWLLAADDMVLAIRQVAAGASLPPLEATVWADAPYRPTPTIIEAAQALFAGHAVAEISRNEAGAKNLSRTADTIGAIVAAAHANRRKAIVFVTGVPGAGKTLAGLNIACSRLGVGGEDATFLSGNGPLVTVLREARARDQKRRARAPATGDPEARHASSRAPDKFVQLLHHFRRDYISDRNPPPEHVVVFDEAQRAWTQAMSAQFMAKHGVSDFDQSEPAFLLSVMDRHHDWCTVVCLIGEGQEINRGEAGIAEWVAALDSPALKQWQVHAPPRLVAGDSPLAQGLRWQLQQRQCRFDAALHLGVSLRSFRSERVSAFVAALLEDDAGAAAALLPDGFPIYRTRQLPAARAWLRAQRRAGERAGLLASANALRLKPEGLHVGARVDVAAWFLNDGDDVRSSNALEDAATEFEVQGLELDWTAVVWDLNMRRSADRWAMLRFRGTRWEQIGADKAAIGRADFVRNAYRVLLTRARQGMMIVVPPGDAADPTRPPAAYDAIDRWLGACGVPVLPG
jgi:hypothetical protein